ncbi:hypothetical protein O181_054980 [Austropuccinia psidii MF-1]|uniref:Uncharacterized protein n=1 Tax=Austropuccinia psidii MF-1 TaxID=1389203 RepID=A0A9Q3E3G2_9BASI|nr:hypothetical protein [Austropuccinia psidii MF-1]
MNIYRKAAKKFWKNYHRTILSHYIQAPLGIVVILIYVFLIDLVIDLLPFTFPASAICMLLLFALMLLLHWLSPNFAFHYFHKFLQPASDWLLASMGLFFTSSFILIPRKDPLSGKQIGLIVAFFLPSFLLMWIGTVAICKLLTILWPQGSSTTNIGEKYNDEKVLKPGEGGISRETLSEDQLNDSPNRLSQHIESETGQSFPTSRPERNDDLETGGAYSPSSSPQVPSCSSSVSERQNNTRNPPLQTHSNTPNLDLQMHATLTLVDEPRQNNFGYMKSISSEMIGMCRFWDFKLLQRTIKQKFSPTQTEKMPPEDSIAIKFEYWFDFVIYLFLAIIGLPLFYTSGGENRSLPLFTGVVSLSWLFSRRIIPQPWQKVLHPILVTSFLTVFIVWGLGAIKGLTLPKVLRYYSTGADYLVLFRRQRGWNGSPPSAGDLMATLLTAGIVSLAFPLFKYRADFFNNFFRLFVVVIPNCVMALLLWPWLAHKIGMTGEQAIAFSGRFMSTPFGIQLLVATGGDKSLVVVLICITGIFAVLVRDPLFKLCRVRITVGSEEYFTIGCTIGVIAAAIGTSSLMLNYPRAAATATVMFIIYGIILLALVAVPNISSYVGHLSGLV